MREQNGKENRTAKRAERRGGGKKETSELAREERIEECKLEREVERLVERLVERKNRAKRA